jgi:hypothetical protein
VATVADLTVRKTSYLVPVSIVGTDVHGRTVVICPQCHDEAPVEADGRVACPTSEAINELLATAFADPDAPTALPDDSPLRSSRG